MVSVIVVDDQQVWTRLLEDIITGVGYCELAASYTEAIGIFKRKQFDYAILDIRLSDVEIHNMGGIELVNWLANEENNTKVIMLTGYATVEVANKAFQMGKGKVIAFLEKGNFSVQELLSLIVETDNKI